MCGWERGDDGNVGALPIELRQRTGGGTRTRNHPINIGSNRNICASATLFSYASPGKGMQAGQFHPKKYRRAVTSKTILNVQALIYTSNPIDLGVRIGGRGR